MLTVCFIGCESRLPMESLEEPVLLEEQTTRSETPTAAWPEQKNGMYYTTV